MVTLNMNHRWRMAYPVGENIWDNKPYIDEMIKTFMSIEAFKEKHVNIICRGSSGAIIAGMFSMSIPNYTKIIHIKKEGENSHGGSTYLGIQQDKINIIVDDFICSGDTVNTIFKKLHEGNILDNVVIHCLCVSGGVELSKIDFRPEYLICGEVKE